VATAGVGTIAWAATEAAPVPALIAVIAFLVIEASASRLRDEADVSLSNIVVFVALLASRSPTWASRCLAAVILLRARRGRCC
jgi:hypothetical protein